MEADDDSTQFARAIEAARQGDASGIEVLFREMQPRLLRFLRSQDREGADDIAAEIWLGVAKTMHAFEGDEAAFCAWFFSIARRRLSDRRRVASRRRTDPVDAAVLSLLPARDEPDRTALDNVSGDAAAQLIASTLNADQAEVLRLRVLGDLSAEQVGAIMGRSPNWVRVAQHRAVNRLGARLASKIRVAP